MGDGCQKRINLTRTILASFFSLNDVCTLYFDSSSINVEKDSGLLKLV